MQLFSLLKQGSRKCRWTTFFAIFLVSCEALFEIFIPRVMALLVDNGIEVGDMSAVYKYGAILIGITLVSLTCGIVSHMCAARASAIFAKTIRADMYEKIQSYSFKNIDKYSSAGLVTRLTTDVTYVQNAFQMLMIMCFRSPCMFIFGIIMAFSINSTLAIIFVCAVPLIVGVGAILIKKALPNFVKVFHQYDHVNMVVQENVNGIRTVKSYVREDQQTKAFKKEASDLYKYSISAEKYLAMSSPLIQFATYGCIIAISWFGAKYIINGIGGMTTGLLMSLISYVTQILMALMMLSMVVVMLVMSKESSKRVSEVLNEQSDITNPANPVEVVNDGSIIFKDVSFAYNPGKEVLEDIDLNIKPGETIGILGGTGSSKSTLIQLIPRLYDPDHGEVLVGGHNVKEYDLEKLRDQVAVVLQKNTLFSGTIKDNLKWGNPNATDEEIVTACKKACADEFIRSFPDGYDTRIEQGGVNVSGGQKQRICIARALLKNPKIIILDDSTSAVDMKTDALIRDSFKNDLPNVTKLVVGQRISSIQNADRILVLDNGHINGFDTHENLLKNNKIYQEVYQTQMEGVEQ
ncbi:MAG: ABC transporter ATP-binding protein [Bacilli bacterium]|nr:ABC transporter ATP-binding protein [Bacilli bacterium]